MHVNMTESIMNTALLIRILQITKLQTLQTKTILTADPKVTEIYTYEFDFYSWKEKSKDLIIFKILNLFL